MTEEKKNLCSDKELMALLERSPQEGTEELFRRYAGLVWSVAEKHLDNPEDIKECVNDTFLEFYLHRERFQPEKGSLKTWLAAIARNLAVSRFRKNAASDAEEWKEDTVPQQDPFDNIEKKMDLEQALEALPREDAEIIRMKYYGGMTVEEIAASLGLPFETVKKRHQRSLKKMKRMLTLGLIITFAAALLAACAYLVLRYFGIVPGYGVVTDPEDAIYTLAEPVVTEGYYGTYTVTEAAVIDGTARIFVDIRIRDEEILEELGDPAQTMNPLLDDMYIISGGGSNLACAAVKYDDLPAEEGMRPMPDMMNWHVIYFAEGVLQPEDGIITLRISEQELTIPMKPAEADELKNYGSILYETGGLAAIPRQEDDRLLIEIYPLNAGEYQISPNLIRDAYMQGKTDDITLAGEDGREYTGEQVYTGQGSFSGWDFGPVEPGAYTLRVPYVYLTAKFGEEESNTVPVNLITGQWEDKAIELPCGTLSIVSLELIDKEDMPSHEQQGNSTDSPEEEEEAWREIFYHYVVHWEPSTAGLEMYSSPAVILTHFGGTLIERAPNPLPDNCFELWGGVSERELNGVNYGDWEELLKNMALTPYGVQNMRWNCTFEIPVTVE